MKTLKIATLVSLAALVGSTGAFAQFPGDLFFLDPSVAVVEGGTAELEVVVFAGANVLGASLFDVTFDPAEVEVTLEPGNAALLEKGFVSRVSPGTASIVNLNSESLTDPIGTVSLARVLVRPLGPAGSVVNLSISVRSLLRQDTTPFPSARGFSGQVVVVSAAGGPATGPSATGSGAPSGLFQKGNGSAEALALEFRRPGTEVEILGLAEEDGLFSAVPQTVLVPDPSAPSEAPRED